MTNNNPIETWTCEQCEEYLKLYPKSLKSETVRKRYQSFQPKTNQNTSSQQFENKKNFTQEPMPRSKGTPETGTSPTSYTAYRITTNVQPTVNPTPPYNSNSSGLKQEKDDWKIILLIIGALLAVGAIVCAFALSNWLYTTYPILFFVLVIIGWIMRQFD